MEKYLVYNDVKNPGLDYSELGKIVFCIEQGRDERD